MERNTGTTKEYLLIVPEQFTDEPHNTVEDHHLREQCPVGNVFFSLHAGGQIAKDQ